MTYTFLWHLTNTYLSHILPYLLSPICSIGIQIIFLLHSLFCSKFNFHWKIQHLYVLWQKMVCQKYKPSTEPDKYHCKNTVNKKFECRYRPIYNTVRMYDLFNKLIKKSQIWFIFKFPMARWCTALLRIFQIHALLLFLQISNEIAWYKTSGLKFPQIRYPCETVCIILYELLVPRVVRDFGSRSLKIDFIKT